VSIRLPDKVLEALYKSTLGQSISIASLDQNWWYRRVEHLVAEAVLAGNLSKDAKLTYRLGDWAFIYNALTTSLSWTRSKFQFIQRRSYTVLLVEVLLDLGADSSIPGSVDHVAMSGTPEALSLILANPLAGKLTTPAIMHAIQGGRVERKHSSLGEECQDAAR
ncbi:Hypothetical protein POVR2_LOCUS304, partial [uncultured virus]